MEWALNLDTILLVAPKWLFCCACEGSNAMRVAVTLALFGPCLSYFKIDPVKSVAIQCCWLYDHRASSFGTSEDNSGCFLIGFMENPLPGARAQVLGLGLAR